eukprot:377767-Lingulodinium_polyedra.AAC.1
MVQKSAVFIQGGLSLGIPGPGLSIQCHDALYPRPWSSHACMCGRDSHVHMPVPMTSVHRRRHKPPPSSP